MIHAGLGIKVRERYRALRLCDMCQGTLGISAQFQIVRCVTRCPLRRLAGEAGRTAALARAGRGMGTVLLGEKDFEPWLSGSAGLELLKPAGPIVANRRPHRSANTGAGFWLVLSSQEKRKMTGLIERLNALQQGGALLDHLVGKRE